VAAEVDVWNLALQMVGAKRVSSTSEDSRNARACLAAYTTIRDGEFRKNVWLFAVARASLAADSTSPDWGRDYAYTLPSDFIRMAPSYPEDNSNQVDWEIEGSKIYTDEDAPLYIRYVSRVTDVTRWDPLFLKACASSLALEICEEITQSTSKKEGIKDDYVGFIREAKKTNAIEKRPAVSPDSTWLTVRQ
jgi:hypothetical protein